MKRLVAAMSVCLALVAASCGAKGNDTAGDDDTGTTAPAGQQASSKGSFGDLKDVCGEAPDGVEVKIPADEAGRGTDKFYLGVANDRTADVRPGLLKEMWDASVAFAGWCNANGGLAGKKIELVDLDGKVLAVEAAMTTACTDVFAMVGGGFASDTLMFSGKDGSDFHKCGLVAIPGFAVSTDFADANGQQQPLPNPGYSKPNTWFRDLVKLYPDNMSNLAVVYGELPSIKINKEQLVATGETVDGVNFTKQISYPVINPNFDLTTQQVKDANVKGLAFIGEPDNLSVFMQKLHQQGWDGLVFAETNHYDPQIFSAGKDAAEGLVIRTAFHPFEEADKWPATKQMLDIVDQYGPSDAKLAGLSIQSFSAWLLFAESVNKCVKDHDGEVTRQCILDSASSFEKWTGGGLHAASSPAKDEGPACSVLMQATAEGTWKRLYPKLGSPDADADGFSCGENVKISGDFGKGNVDPSRKS